jgi:RNA polymerase sigma-70 factor (ECF subfamily)
MTLTVLERIAAGEAAAVQECMSAYGGLVWSLALRMSPGRADAEDAVQEVFMDLWRNAGAYDPAKSPEKVFIAMIARRRLIDRWRSRSRRLETDPLEDSESFLEQNSEASPVVGVELAEAMDAIDTLDAEQRQVVLMGVVQGMTHSEIARETGKPLGTVKTQMRRGLIRVRALLSDGSEQAAGSQGVGA